LSSVLLEFIESNDLDSTEAPKPRERSESTASSSSPPLQPPDSHVAFQSEEDEEDALSAAIAMSLSDIPSPPKQTVKPSTTAKPMASPNKKPPVNHQRADGLDNIADKLGKATIDDDLMADSYIAPSALEVLMICIQDIFIFFSAL
jgi:hypothetical protein